MSYRATRTVPAAFLCLLLAGNATHAQTVYVPKPKGAGETLDSSTAPTDSPLKPDILQFGAASKVGGKVLRITPQGLITLASPDFQGELNVKLKSAGKITFGFSAKSDKKKRYDRVLLSNQDVFCGEILAITPEAVDVREPAVGIVRIARRVVRSVAFGSDSLSVVDTNFAEGVGPWKARQGPWKVENGRYTCRAHGSNFAWVEAEQEGAVTYEWSMKPGQSYIQAGIVVMASSNTEYWGRNALAIQISGNYIYCYAVRNGSTNHVGRYRANQQIKGGTFRMHWDPEKKKARLWKDNVQVGDWTVGNAPAKGKYVMLVSQTPCSYGHVKVTRGLTATTQIQSDKQADRIVLRNKDRISGNVVSLDQGILKVTTPYGAMDIQVARAGEIIFSTAKMETPRRRARDVLAAFNNSRMTVELTQMTAAGLQGKTEYAGDLVIERDALKSMQFNLYD